MRTWAQCYDYTQASLRLSHWHLPPTALFSLSCPPFHWASLPQLHSLPDFPPLSSPLSSSPSLWESKQGVVALGGTLLRWTEPDGWLRSKVRTRDLFRFGIERPQIRKSVHRGSQGRHHKENLQTCLQGVRMWWLTGGSHCLWFYRFLSYWTRCRRPEFLRASSETRVPNMKTSQCGPTVPYTKPQGQMCFRIQE